MPIKDPDKRREYQREYQRKHYSKKSQYYKDKAKAKQQLLGEIIREAKNVPCTDCGVKYPYYVMQFDHVRGVKLMHVSLLAKRGSLQKVHDELAKCEVVCANCHAERTAQRSGLAQR